MQVIAAAMVYKLLFLLASSCLVLGALLQLSDAAQCTPQPANPCLSRCNGTLINISDIFDYPVKISDPRGYTYYWDCNGLKCLDQVDPPDGDSAVCQDADQWFNCGRVREPIWLLNGYYPTYSYELQYPWGTDGRIAVFRFYVDSNQIENTIHFDGEQPYRQYNFVVRGKCIGQPYCQEGELLPAPIPRTTQHYVDGGNL